MTSITTEKRPRRSRLAKAAARERYVRMAELVVLEQIRKDSASFDDGSAIAVGPFARLDANAVAARDGKTRGAITNLFGSQAAFQAATMALALNASTWVDRVTLPEPGDYARAEAWLDALLAGQAARGPAHQAKAAMNDGTLWALWLATVPYGLWSEQVAQPSMAEYAQWAARLEAAIRQALDRFGLGLRAGTTPADLACALASLIEGAWLNQCLTASHPLDPAQPVAALLARSGRLLWHGAVEPAPRGRRRGTASARRR